MKKNIWIIGGVVVVLLCGIFFFFKEDSFEKKMETLNENMNSYKLEGSMDIVKGEDIKKYAIEVGYKKSNDNDLFRVSITDKELNQTQVILRNKEGVYVLTPTLNQIFKFEGDWPLNSLKPYLIQSMNEILKSDSCVIEKVEEGYKAKSNVNYPNNPNFKVQEMIFDENAHIRELSIFDESDVLQLAIVFNDTNYEAKLKDTYFELEKDLKSETSSTLMDEMQMPLYPMHVFDSTLTSAQSMEVATGMKYVLQYSGDKNFTIVESLRKQSENTETIIMAGELMDSIDAFGFYDGNHMQLIMQGVEYTIYSDDLAPEEMAQILNSMQVVVMK